MSKFVKIETFHNTENADFCTRYINPACISEIRSCHKLDWCVIVLMNNSDHYVHQTPEELLAHIKVSNTPLYNAMTKDNNE